MAGMMKNINWKGSFERDALVEDNADYLHWVQLDVGLARFHYVEIRFENSIQLFQLSILFSCARPVALDPVTSSIKLAVMSFLAPKGTRSHRKMPTPNRPRSKRFKFVPQELAFRLRATLIARVIRRLRSKACDVVLRH